MVTDSKVGKLFMLRLLLSCHSCGCFYYCDIAVFVTAVVVIAVVVTAVYVISVILLFLCYYRCCYYCS